MSRFTEVLGHHRKTRQTAVHTCNAYRQHASSGHRCRPSSTKTLSKRNQPLALGHWPFNYKGFNHQLIRSLTAPTNHGLLLYRSPAVFRTGSQEWSAPRVPRLLRPGKGRNPREIRALLEFTVWPSLLRGDEEGGSTVWCISAECGSLLSRTGSGTTCQGAIS